MEMKEERITELEKRSIECIQSEEEKEKFEKKMNKASKTDVILSKELLFMLLKFQKGRKSIVLYCICIQ